MDPDPPRRVKKLRKDSPSPNRPGRRFRPAESLTIVIPARNEAASLEVLVEELTVAFRGLQDRAEELRNPLAGFEILIVDDGSTDSTRSVLEQLIQWYPELRFMRLAQPAGQSAALFAGFRAARSTWVAMLDADLQNPPAELARLWEFLPGYDAVFGWRSNRQDHWTRRISSRLANSFRRWALGDTIRDTGCSIRIFRRAVAHRLPAFRGAHRFLGPLLLRECCKIIQAPVAHRPRFHGKSHYHVWNRSLNVLVDLLGVAWLAHRSIPCEVLTDSSDRQYRRLRYKPRQTDLQPSTQARFRAETRSRGL